MLLAFRKPPVFSKKWWLIWLFFFGVSSSHGILDAFTNGGLGIALLSPFNTTRYFSPWRPLVLAPMEIRALFTPLGKEMLLSELYWIWLPLILALIIAKAYRKIKLRNHNKTRKAECQSVELAKNVFKRLFVVLLIILLIAGIFFQAPWKVLALLAIFLAALTVLPRPARKWFWLSTAVVIIALIIWVFLPDWGEWKPYKYNFNEELAALNDKYAIPDEENAAIIYNQLLEDYDESSLSPVFLDEDLDNLTRSEPWLSKDYPELAEWLKDQQDTISTLLQASKKEKCRFPIIIDFQQMTTRIDRFSAMRRWAFLLVRAANNDIAEGRIDAGIQKYRCLLQMGNHLCQQSRMVDYLVGIAVEAIALSRMKTFILESDATEAHLKTIEAALPQTKNNWTEISSKILEFETLYERKNVGLFDRLKFAWQGIRVEDTFERIQEIYLRLLADRRGNRILIALRRYKNKNDRWPKSLNELKSFPPAEIFIDPINGSSFVYKLTKENFTLYSKGKNNIDEDGIRRVTFDPNDFKWPKTEEDDILIWPPRTRKTQKESPDNE